MTLLKNHSDGLEIAIIDYNLSQDVEKILDYVNLDSINLMLRKYITSKEMKKMGSFFTERALAEELVNSSHNPISKKSVVFDPCCGAGNLLIQASKSFRVFVSLSKTLNEWGQKLCGVDNQPDFIRIAKLRLIIEALNRGCQSDCSLTEAIQFFNRIEITDIFSLTPEKVSDVTHFLVNPPFVSCQSPQKNYWKKGKVNSAGVFTDYILRIAPTGACLSYILPDVLRSGSRYDGFRHFMDSKLIARCQVWGKFNSSTDIDVFILSGYKKENSKPIMWFKEVPNHIPLSRHYEVSVGSLVAYRDKREGNCYPYLHAKNTEKWKQISEISEKRNFSGRTVESPFVVIKRTSSPSDKDRAVASLVNIPNAKVAVENHLIIVKPKSGKLKDCVELLEVLKNQRTNDFLNDRARMRHLTVEVVKSIPL